MIHRAIVSTMERMISYLIELYAGAFPVWLAPVQAAVLPITDRQTGVRASGAKQPGGRRHPRHRSTSATRR